MFRPGDYRVPQDMSQEFAERALKEGFASRLHQQREFSKSGAPENKGVPESQKKAEGGTAKKGAKKAE